MVPFTPGPSSGKVNDRSRPNKDLPSRMISTLPSISEAVGSIRAGSLSPRDLVEACLAQIAEQEDRVRAWVMIDAEGARREAERLGSLASRGTIVGPLHGIPIGIKDIVDVAGWPTRCGSPLRGGTAASRDAVVVQRLRAAGAILLGKTVTTQFASFDPPPTRNPWNPTRTPGGSSSGSAAAVATQMCMAAIGSQTGGSIIRPAAYCGVAGFKPTFGAASLDGIEPLAWHLDHVGPIARHVDDLRIVQSVLNAYEIPMQPPTSATRLLVMDGFFRERASDEVREVMDAAIARWRRAGIHIEPATDQPLDFAAIVREHRIIMAVEAAAHHRAEFARAPDQFGPCVAGLIREGLAATAVDFAAALQSQTQARRELARWLPHGCCLLMPATTTVAPDAATTGDPAFNSPWSFLGWPSATVPVGVGPSGLPVGLQWVAAAGDDALVLSVAEQCGK